MLFTILKYSIGSLFWGFLISAVLMTLFIVVIRGWYKNAVFKLFSWIITALLGIILFWNATLISGAFAIKKASGDVEEMLNTYVMQAFPYMNQILTAEETNEAFQSVVAEHPILYNYADWANFEGYTVAEYPSALCKTLNSYLNNYILKKCLWSLGFVIVGATLVIWSLEKQNRQRGQRSPLPNRNMRSRPEARRPVRRTSF